MSRKYYKRIKIFKLTRNERKELNMIVGVFKFIFMFISEMIKGIYDLSKYIRKITKNYYALKNIGYDLEYIMNMVYTITPRQFEYFIAELFKYHGYKTRVTKSTNDYGRDIILNDNIFVECKQYGKDVYVGREICQKLLGSVQMFGAEKAIIITTGKYHRNAYEVASKVNNLQLMNIYDIQKMILGLTPEQIGRITMKVKNVP